jgi:hypothetical protein
MFYPGKYPPDFLDESCARVDIEEILAKREYDQARLGHRYGHRDHLRTFTLRVLLAFAKEARDHRLWPVTDMDEYCREYLRKFTIYANHGRESIISNWSGSIVLEWQQFLERSDLWRQYEDILLEVADRQAAGTQAAQPNLAPVPAAPSATETPAPAAAEASAPAEPGPATGPLAAEPLTLAEWLQAEMDTLGIRTAYGIQQLGGPKQVTTKRIILKNLPVRPSTVDRLVKALNWARAQRKLPPIEAASIKLRYAASIKG